MSEWPPASSQWWWWAAWSEALTEPLSCRLHRSLFNHWPDHCRTISQRVHYCLPSGEWVDRIRMYQHITTLVMEEGRRPSRIPANSMTRSALTGSQTHGHKWLFTLQQRRSCRSFWLCFDKSLIHCDSCPLNTLLRTRGLQWMMICLYGGRYVVWPQENTRIKGDIGCNPLVACETTVDEALLYVFICELIQWFCHSLALSWLLCPTWTHKGPGQDVYNRRALTKQ